MLWLDEDELVTLTGYRQRTKQREALSRLGVKFRSRPADGFPLVERAQFQGQLTGKAKRAEPDFSYATR